nr:type II toxin-antitoxin system RelE/ParE family toxin [Cyanobium sp. HWJ4-Hawea]
MRARARVQFRPVRFGISELRINYGPGYRVYYQQKDSKLIILLAGGDKSSQSWDIEEALILARQIKEDG